MNNKKCKKIEKHYNKLVKNKTIKTFNDALIYKRAIDKAFSLFDVGESKIKDDNWSKLTELLQWYRDEKVIVDSFEENRGSKDISCDGGFVRTQTNGEITITINLRKE